MMIQIIEKRPGDKVGRLTWAGNSLKNLQGRVGGNIQAVELTNDVVMLCNEDGKILGLPENFRLPWGDVVMGTVILCGAKGDNFADVPIGIDEWAELLTSFKSS